MARGVVMGQMMHFVSLVKFDGLGLGARDEQGRTNNTDDQKEKEFFHFNRF